MIDTFSLALAHGLLMLAAILLLRRPDLDKEPGDTEERPRKRRGATPGA